METYGKEGGSGREGRREGRTHHRGNYHRGNTRVEEDKKDGREGGKEEEKKDLTTAATHSLIRCLSHRDWRRSWMRAASVWGEDSQAFRSLRGGEGGREGGRKEGGRRVSE